MCVADRQPHPHLADSEGIGDDEGPLDARRPTSGDGRGDRHVIHHHVRRPGIELHVGRRADPGLADHHLPQPAVVLYRAAQREGRLPDEKCTCSLSNLLLRRHAERNHRRHTIHDEGIGARPRTDLSEGIGRPDLDAEGITVLGDSATVECREIPGARPAATLSCPSRASPRLHAVSGRLNAQGHRGDARGVVRVAAERGRAVGTR